MRSCPEVHVTSMLYALREPTWVAILSSRALHARLRVTQSVQLPPISAFSVAEKRP